MKRDEQITAKQLREYLSHIPDDTKIGIGYGEKVLPVVFFTKEANALVLWNDVFGAEQAKNNLITMLKFNQSKGE